MRETESQYALLEAKRMELLEAIGAKQGELEDLDMKSSEAKSLKLSIATWSVVYEKLKRYSVTARKPLKNTSPSLI